MLQIGQHTLINQPDNDGPFKHCILVKLTESSTQAIEDFLRNKDNTEKRPSISFQKDKGEICFPIETKSGSNMKKFAIAISSVKEAMKQDTSASVECVAYQNSKFKKLGTIESKIAIQAIKDEVFQATMEKVNNVEEDKKNNSTREIKHSGAIVNRNSLGGSNQNNQNNSRAKQIAASLAANNNLKPKTMNERPINDRPLKERIIHLLALKPYMKPELMLRLKKDNPLTERETEQLDLIIQSVGVLNHKNQYELTSEIMLNEVKEEWLFYNSSEKLIAKRNIANFKQKLNSSLNTSNSKLNTSLNSNKQFSSSSAFSSISSSSNSMNKSNLDEKKTSPLKGSMELSTNGKITPNLMRQRNMHIQKSSISPDSPDDKDFELVHKSSKIEKNESYPDFKRLKPNGNISNQRDDIKRPEFSEIPLDFSKKYKPIQSKQQLKQYTLEFDQNHKEYSDLYEYLAPTAKQFDMYKKELEDMDENSKDAKEKKETILRVYFERKNDPEFNKKRERYDYLDMKLNHIKDLIEQYKEKNEPQINLSPFSP